MLHEQLDNYPQRTQCGSGLENLDMFITLEPSTGVKLINQERERSAQLATCSGPEDLSAAPEFLLVRGRLELGFRTVGGSRYGERDLHTFAGNCWIPPTPPSCGAILGAENKRF